jgi:hypothetical protein
MTAGIRLHIVRRHQLHVVPQAAEFPNPIVRRCAGLNADQGVSQLREERQDFTAPRAPLHRDIPG